MGFTASKPSYAQSEGGVEIHLNMADVVRDCKSHLLSLEGAAWSISSATDAQYELIQNFLDGKGILQPPADDEYDTCTEIDLSFESLNQHQQKCLAYLQDSICVQSGIIAKTVAHLKDLFDRITGPIVSSVDKKYTDDYRRKVRVEKSGNQQRLDLIYLRSNYAEQKKKLEEMEEHIKQLAAEYEEKSGKEGKLKNHSGNLHIITNEELSDPDWKKKPRGEKTINLSDEKISNLVRDFSNLELEIKKKDGEIMQYKEDIHSWKEDNSAKNNKLEQQALEISSLKEEISDLKKNNSLLNSEMGKFSKREEREKRKVDQEREEARNTRFRLDEKIRKLEKENDKMMTGIQMKKKEIHSLKEYAEQLLREKQTAEERLRIAEEKLHRHQKVSVMMYTPRRGDLLNMVVGELKSMLALQFTTQEMNLNVVDCENPSQIEPSKPVIVVCINASRLGTDVTNALTGIIASPYVAVVILHHKELHALPNQASERVLTSQEYKPLGEIIDMAFLSSRGIYPCDMNNTAVSQLVEFIKQRNR